MPLASLVVPLSGIFVIAGGLSILLGYRAKLAAGIIMLFSSSHDLNDGQVLGYARPTDRPAAYGAVHGNVALIGGALLISQFGAGPISVDAWRTR